MEPDKDSTNKTTGYENSGLLEKKWEPKQTKLEITILKKYFVKLKMKTMFLIY